MAAGDTANKPSQGPKGESLFSQFCLRGAGEPFADTHGTSAAAGDTSDASFVDASGYKFNEKDLKVGKVKLKKKLQQQVKGEW